MKGLKRYIATSYAAVAAILLLLGLYSCASIGSPSGGPRDEDAPIFVKSRPAPFATNFRGDRVEIEFDELVAVKDAFTSVTVSPPVFPAPKVSASGRKIIVQFDDTLASNTTYTVDFGKAIEDVNESNKLGGFSFSFSTGEDVDSLQIAGVVLDAKTLEPQQGVLVGAYTALTDTTFRKVPFERVTKTDDRGRFVLRSLKGIPYRLFTLGDLNNDYRWDNPAEAVGFYPEAVTPYSETVTASDTIYNRETGSVDTVTERLRTRFLPNNLLIPSFSTGYKPQYLTDNQREDSTRINLRFNTRLDRVPELRLLNRGGATDWYVAERNLTNDTLSYYIKPEFARIDTLKVTLTYPRTEGVDNALTMVTDTLDFITKRPKVKARKRRSRKQIEADSIAALNARFIDLKAVSSTTQEIYAPAVIEFSEPLQYLRADAVRVEVQQDSLWLPVAGVTLEPDSLVPRRMRVHAPWEFDSQYRIVADSLAGIGLTGRGNRTFTFMTKTRPRSGYSSLTLRLTPDSVKGFVEILDATDKPVWKQTVENGTVTVPYLVPQEYYVRFTADADGDGEFTPGDIDTGQQPEEVWYYPKAMDLRRFDRNETWDLNAVAVDAQKPERVKQNKPDRVKKPTKKSKKNRRGGSGEENTDNEEDDYFDVNRNPFDPNYKRRSSTAGSY